MTANADIRSMIGLLFVWKVALLVAFALWMIVSLRPFCRTICPLGAILGLFNKVSLLPPQCRSASMSLVRRLRPACPVDLDVPAPQQPRVHPVLEVRQSL